jgi:hypothetical protein
MDRINVWLNTAANGSGAWHMRQILDANSGTVTFDLVALAFPGAGTFLMNIDLYDEAGNHTYWWETHASPQQVGTWTRAGDPTPPSLVSVSFNPTSGSQSPTLGITVTASDTGGSGMDRINVWLNTQANGSGTWHMRQILDANSGTVNFDLATLGSRQGRT